MPQIEKAKQILSNALSLPESEINNDLNLMETSQWDSIAHMNLILAIEADLGRNVNTEEALGIESLASVVALLES